jgi:putative PEP-CTERM system TPR-repeat lipoprotein
MPTRFALLRTVAGIGLSLLLSLSSAAFGADTDADPLQSAHRHQEQGDLRAAVIELKNILQQNPNQAEARLLLGRIYLQLEQGAAAEKELNRARELGADPRLVAAPLAEALLLQGNLQALLDQPAPAADLAAGDRAKLYALRGIAYLAKQQGAAASEAFQQALALQPGQPQALLGQATQALAENKPDQARQLLDQLLASAPTYSRAWLLSGNLEQSQGRLENAEAAYSKAIEHSPLPIDAQLRRALIRIDRKDYAGASADIAAVRKLVPEHPAMFYAQGLLDFQQKKLAEAQSGFDQALKANPNHLQALFYRGATHLAQGHWQQAEMDLQRVHSSLPNLEPATKLLVEALFRLDRPAEAEAVLQPLLAKQPTDLALLEQMARLKTAQGDHAAAKHYLQQIIAQQPEAALPQAQLGASLLQQGEADVALAALEKAVKLDPTLHQADVTLILGYLQNRKFDEALAAANRLQANLPDKAGPWNLVGFAQLGKNQPDQARQAFQQALKLQPGQPMATSALAQLALQAGQPDQARAYLQETLKQLPDHPPTLLRLARLELQTGQKDTARQYLDKAIAKQPDLLEARLLLTRLQLQAGEPLKALQTLNGLPEAQRKQPAVQLALAEAQLRTGNANAALDLLQPLAEAQPQAAAVQYWLALAYVATANADHLRQTLQRGLALQPNLLLYAPLLARLVTQDAAQAEQLLRDLKAAQLNSAAVLELEGQLALHQGRLSQAVATYRQARQRFPDDNRWVLALAQAQQQAFDQTGSLATLQDWVKAHPDDVTVLLALAAAQLGQQQLEAAQATYAKVVELTPNNALALNNLAWLQRQSQPQQALANAERAVQLNNAPMMLDTLAVILLEQGQSERALKLLQDAAQRQPDESLIQFHLAQALSKRGDTATALQVLYKLLQGNQKFAEREQARALLKQLGGTPPR